MLFHKSDKHTGLIKSLMIFLKQCEFFKNLDKHIQPSFGLIQLIFQT